MIPVFVITLPLTEVRISGVRVRTFLKAVFTKPVEARFLGAMLTRYVGAPVTKCRNGSSFAPMVPVRPFCVNDAYDGLSAPMVFVPSTFWGWC